MTRYVVWVLLAASLTSCATGGAPRGEVRNDAFAAFTTSVEELRTGTDEILAGLVEKSKARFRANVAQEIRSGEELPTTLLALADVQFTTENNAFAIVDAPYFLRVPAFKLAQYQTNSALVGYASLLETLANPEAVDSENDITALREDLNGNVQSAAKGINSDIKPEDAGKLAVVSSIAGGFIQSYLDKKHKGDLIAAINENQSAIVSLAAHLQEGTRVLNYALQQEFNQEQEKYTAVSEDLDAGADARITAALKVVDLVQQRFVQQEILLKLHESYGRLPAAHQALATLKPDDSSGLARIISLAETAQSLKTTYAATVSQTRKEHIQAEADRAEALATAAEVEASQASVTVATAIVHLERVKTELVAAPDDEALLAQVAEHEKALETLKNDQQIKLANAQALRAAANAVAAATTGLLELIN